MKDYLNILQTIDRDALKAKAETARQLAEEYAQLAKAAAGDYAREAKHRAEEALHSPRAEAFAAHAKLLAQDARADAADLCAFTSSRMSGFSPFDLAILRLLLVSFGLWLGSWIAGKCSKLAEKLRPVFLATFLCGFTYIAYRIFFDSRD